MKCSREDNFLKNPSYDNRKIYLQNCAHIKRIQINSQSSCDAPLLSWISELCVHEDFTLYLALILHSFTLYSLKKHRCFEEAPHFLFSNVLFNWFHTHSLSLTHTLSLILVYFYAFKKETWDVCVQMFSCNRCFYCGNISCWNHPAIEVQVQSCNCFTVTSFYTFSSINSDFQFFIVFMVTSTVYPKRIKPLIWKYWKDPSKQNRKLTYSVFCCEVIVFYF